MVNSDYNDDLRLRALRETRAYFSARRTLVDDISDEELETFMAYGLIVIRLAMRDIVETTMDEAAALVKRFGGRPR